MGIEGSRGLGPAPRVDAGTGPLDVVVDLSPNATYAIDAAGAVRLQNDLRINGVLNPNNALTIGSDTTVQGTLQSGGRGLVKGPGAAMQRMFRAQLTLGASVAAGGSVDSGDYVFPAGLFSAPPIVMIGQLVSASGGDGARLQFVPFNTRANATQFRVFNHSSSPVSITATYEILAIGPESRSAVVRSLRIARGAPACDGACDAGSSAPARHPSKDRRTGLPSL